MAFGTSDFFTTALRVSGPWSAVGFGLAAIVALIRARISAKKEELEVVTHKLNESPTTDELAVLLDRWTDISKLPDDQQLDALKLRAADEKDKRDHASRQLKFVLITLISLALIGSSLFVFALVQPNTTVKPGENQYAWQKDSNELIGKAQWPIPAGNLDELQREGKRLVSLLEATNVEDLSGPDYLPVYHFYLGADSYQLALCYLIRYTSEKDPNAKEELGRAMIESAQVTHLQCTESKTLYDRILKGEKPIAKWTGAQYAVAKKYLAEHAAKYMAEYDWYIIASYSLIARFNGTLTGGVKATKEEATSQWDRFAVDNPGMAQSYDDPNLGWLLNRSPTSIP